MTLMQEIIRFITTCLSGGVMTFSFVRSRSYVGSKRWAMYTLTCYAASAMLRQVAFFRHPLTFQTWLTMAAGLVGTVYIMKARRERKHM